MSSGVSGAKSGLDGVDFWSGVERGVGTKSGVDRAVLRSGVEESFGCQQRGSQSGVEGFSGLGAVPRGVSERRAVSTGGEFWSRDQCRRRGFPECQKALSNEKMVERKLDCHGGGDGVGGFCGRAACREWFGAFRDGEGVFGDGGRYGNSVLYTRATVSYWLSTFQDGEGTLGGGSLWLQCIALCL